MASNKPGIPSTHGFKQARTPTIIPEFTHDTGIIIVFATRGRDFKNTFCELLDIGTFRPISKVSGASDSSHLQFAEPFYINRHIEYTEPAKDGGKPHHRRISCVQLLSLTEFSNEDVSGDVDILASLCALLAALNMRSQPLLGFLYLGESNTFRIGAETGNLITKLARDVLNGHSMFVFVSMSWYDRNFKGLESQLAHNEVKIEEWVSGVFDKDKSSSALQFPVWNFLKLTHEPQSAADIVLFFLLKTGAPASAPLLQVQLPDKSKLSDTAVGSRFNAELVKTICDYWEDEDGDILDELHDVDLLPEHLDALFQQYSAYLELHSYSQANDFEKWKVLCEALSDTVKNTNFVLVFDDSHALEDELSGDLHQHFPLVQIPLEEATYFILIPTFQNTTDDALILTYAIKCLAFLATFDLKLSGLVYFWPEKSKHLDDLVQCNLRILSKICGFGCLEYLVLVKKSWDSADQNDTIFQKLVGHAKILERNNKDSETLGLEIIEFFDLQPHNFDLMPNLAVWKEFRDDGPFSTTSSGLEIQSFLTSKLGNLQAEYSRSRHTIPVQPLLVDFLPVWQNQLDILFLQWGLIHFSGANQIYQNLNKVLQDDANIEKAITQLEAIISLQSNLYPGKGYKVAHLGGLYNAHWELYGDSQDLSHAIKQYDIAISLISEDDPKKAEYVSVLGSHLEKRFQLHGAKDDLLRAIQKCQEAVDLCYKDLSPQTNIQKAFALHALGTILKQKFEAYFDDINDIDKAILTFHDAQKELPTGHNAKTIIFSDLCHSYTLRSKYHSQKDIKMAQAVLDIENAMAQYEKTLPEPGPKHPGYAMILNAKCQAYAKHYKLTKIKGMTSKNAPNIQEAIRAGEVAADYSRGTSQECTYLLNLGKAYFYYHEEIEASLSKNELPTVLVQAIECFCQAAQCETADHMVRFKAARNWAKLETKEKALRVNKEPAGTVKAYEYCIILLAEIAGQEIPIHEQYRRLEKIQKVVYHATAAAIQFGHLNKAVEFFEEGRSVMWKHYFKHDVLINALKEKYPDLARDYIRHLNQLRSNAADAGNSITYMKATLPDQKKTQAPSSNLIMSGLKHVWNAITSITDFSTFSFYKQLPLLNTATEHGPIILVNLCNDQCDALILQKKHATIHVKLPITTTEAKNLQKSLKVCLGGRSGLSRAMKFYQPSSGTQSSMKYILKKLWISVVDPIVKKLINSSTLPGSHIFWCTSGPLAFLPLHAAGQYDVDDNHIKLPDFFHSSYIPNIFSLLRKPAPSKLPFQVLAIAQSNTPGFSSLPNTLLEVQKIATRAIANAKILKNEENTVEKVKKELMKSQWVHFACHGIQDEIDGLKSGLILHGGERLTLKDLVDLKIPNAEFAFLSACQSAKGDITLPEEQIHLAAGMLVVGYQGVIATMWNIGDEDGLFVATEVYNKLFPSSGKKGPKPDFKQAVHALEDAVEKLRGDKKADYMRWVPFIHIGL